MDIIATRTLDVLDSGGQPSRTITVLIGKPTPEPTGEWGCPYQVVGIGSGRIFRAFGVDGIQAIEGALKVVGGILEGSEEWKEGRLRFMGEKELGFPSIPDPPTSPV